MPSIRPALTLVALISVSAIILSILYDITREPIRLQQIASETAIVSELLPGTARTAEELITGGPVTKVVTGYDAQGVILGYVVTASYPGYAGPVEIMAGFDATGTLTGVRVSNQRETPGLGTAILNQAFLAQFEGRTETMAVTRMPTAPNEIEALASATISTAAVVNGINAAIAFISGSL